MTRRGRRSHAVVVTVPTDSKAADEALKERAMAQHGLICWRQALQHGMAASAIARRVRSKHWFTIRRGVYAYAGTPITRRGVVMAACLAAGEGAVVHGFTAAELHRLKDAWFRKTPCIAVPATRELHVPGVRIVAEDVPAAHRVVVDGIPVLSGAAAMAVMAEVLPARKLELCVMDAIGRGVMTLAGLAEVTRGLEPGGARERLERVLALHTLEVFARSHDERRAIQQLRGLGWSDPAVNQPLAYGPFDLREPDLLFRARRVIVEIDGPFHASTSGMLYDALCDTLWRGAGYSVVRVTPDELGIPGTLSRKLAEQCERRTRPLPHHEFEALSSRAWAHYLAECDRLGVSPRERTRT